MVKNACDTLLKVIKKWIENVHKLHTYDTIL